MLVIVAALGATCALVLLLIALRSSMATVSNSVQGMFSSTFSGITENTGSDGGGTPTRAKTAFAVYSADDGSLNFYKRITVPAVGEAFQGKTVTAVYKGFEQEAYRAVLDVGGETTAPWYEQHANVKTVTIVDVGIKPVSMAFWFQRFSALEVVVDLEKLDTSGVRSFEHAFAYCTTLQYLNLDRVDVSNALEWNSAFSNCPRLRSISLLNWSLPDGCCVNFMYAGDWNLSEIIGMDTWSAFSPGGIADVFWDCSSLTTLDLSAWSTSNSGDSEFFCGKTYPQQVKVGSDWRWGTKRVLPAVDSQNVQDGDGKWYALSDGSGYAPSDVPSGVADTYYVTKALRDAAARGA